MSDIQEFSAFNTDLRQAILWQYSDAPNIDALIDKKNTWYNIYQYGFYGYLYFNIFDLRTADNFGLAIWSIILGLPLLVPSTPYTPQPTFGFNEDDGGFINDYENFERGNFSTYRPYLTLTAEENRFLLRLRYYQLSCLSNIADFINDTPYSINDFLNYLCSDSEIDYSGTIYVIDNFDMTMTYHFSVPGFPLQLYNALVVLDVLPRPAGVEIIFTGLT